MKMRDLVAKAIEELNDDEKKLAVHKIKERLVEIREAKRVLNKLEAQYKELLAEDVADASEITDIE